LYFYSTDYTTTYINLKLI